MKVGNLLTCFLYSSRDHRGRAFDVREATGSATKSLTGRMALRLGAWGTLMTAAGVLSWRSWHLARVSGGPSIFGEFNVVGVFLAVAIIVSVIRMATELPRERRRRCEALAACGRCGGCGYDLAEVDEEPDGCRVCPECGTAWRRSRATFCTESGLRT